MTNIWGLEKKIDEVRKRLKEEEARGRRDRDDRLIKNCQRKIRRLKREIEKIRRQRKENGKRKRR